MQHGWNDQQQWHSANPTALRSPAKWGQLKRLEVLKTSKNNLTVLNPSICSCSLHTDLMDEVLRCRALRTLDISGNQLTELPLNIGDLQNLAELVLCEKHLPSSVGQLKRLEVLKASKKNLTVLTPSICSCSLHTDLILCDNQLQLQRFVEAPFSPLMNEMEGEESSVARSLAPPTGRPQ
ncbi:hypothetical protein niasHS_015753 [Heterodera schachtii]|uniref:Uncharacterized protein n=1 Tax=Heterodera schachtii TaxID=97005 RepID=A0ABD2HSB3_HETSC